MDLLRSIGADHIKSIRSALSKVIPEIPVVAFEYVFISPEVRERAEEWLENNRERIIRLYGEEV
jgi:hypothetical protein